MSHPSTIQGWKAELNLEFKKISSKTVLAHRSQFGPLTVQRPFYPEGDVCHLYLLHPPGGVVGGDQLNINIKLEERSQVLITTPGATKFYRSGSPKQKGKLATQNQILHIAKDCSLEWFPQENIFFDNTHSQLLTKIELEADAKFMGWEINCYGRPASNESFGNGKVNTRLELYRNGQPLILDGLTVGESNALSSSTSLNNYPCFGTFISTHATKELLDKARASVENCDEDLQVGLTLMDDILVVRCLGQYAEQVSTTLRLVWSAIRADILNRDPCPPRIWST